MKTLFQDEFLYKKMLSRMTKEVKKEQLSLVIDEINCLNEMQKKVISKYNLMPSLKENFKK